MMLGRLLVCQEKSHPVVIYMTGNMEFHELSALPIIELNKDAPSHLAIVIKLPTLPPTKYYPHKMWFGEMFM